MKTLCTIFFTAFVGMLFNLQAQHVTIDAVKEYDLPNGYTCNTLEVIREEIVVTCPQTQGIYYAADGSELKEIRYTLGRGPGELNRAPFGTGILNDRIVFADPDLQRLFIYDKQSGSFSVKPIRPKEGLFGVHTWHGDSLIFIRNQALESLGSMYNIYTDEFLEDFLLDTPFENAFSGDGPIQIQENLLLFGSAYEGYVTVWDIEKRKQIAKYQLFKNKDTEPRRARMHGLLGSIPPNAESTIKGVGWYQHSGGQPFILVLIKSKEGTYDMDKIYVYDTGKKEFARAIALPANAHLFDVSGEYLYVYYNELDKLIKYKLALNN